MSDHPPQIGKMKFDSLGVGENGGEIVFTRFPGRGEGEDFSLERLDAVFSGLVDRGCQTLLSLSEDDEFEGFCGKSVFAEKVAQFQFTWRHLPIRDYQIPDAIFLAAWHAQSVSLLTRLNEGHDVCVHCKGGIGRSGTVAALLLIDNGVENEDAIIQVRQSRSGAIETREQEAFVRAYKSQTA